MTFALGIDLGGSSVKAVAVTPEGRLLGETNVPFEVSEPGDSTRRVRRSYSGPHAFSVIRRHLPALAFVLLGGARSGARKPRPRQ